MDLNSDKGLSKKGQPPTEDTLLDPFPTVAVQRETENTLLELLQFFLNLQE